MPAPHWAEIVGWISLGVGFASALLILGNEVLLGQRQQMAVMNLVHPITALYWGPFWLLAYLTQGRKSSRRLIEVRVNRPGESGDSSPWKGWGHVREHIEEVPGRTA